MNNELIPTEIELRSYQLIAKQAQNSKFFDKLGGEGGILSIMLFARELGLSPMTCLFGGMSNIQGKIEISPRMMNSMIRKAGHSIKVEASDKVCTMTGKRSDNGDECTVIYTIEEAARAGLVKNGTPWEKYPSDMLFARCMSRLARRLFADVISTAYVDGEIDEEKTPAPIIDITPDKPVEEKKEEGCLTYEQEMEIREALDNDEQRIAKLLAHHKIDLLDELPLKEFAPLMAKYKKGAK